MSRVVCFRSLFIMYTGMQTDPMGHGALHGVDLPSDNLSVRPISGFGPFQEELHITDSMSARLLIELQQPGSHPWEERGCLRRLHWHRCLVRKATSAIWWSVSG